MAYLSAHLPVLALAVESVAVFEAAVDRYRVALGLAPVQSDLQPGRVAASFLGDRLMRIDGEPISGFAELSGFFETADGWIRTHANYPHHRARLLGVLGLPGDADRAATTRRLRGLSADAVESDAAGAGAIAVRVRTEAEWAASPQGQAAATGPLVGSTPRADSGSAANAGSATVDRPLDGVKVLDLTRVIAGPTATRALALVGADVLRIDAPQLPEIPWQHLETGQGKRSALLDLRSAQDHKRFRDLLAAADVLVTGYRPGAFDKFGIDPAVVRPGIIDARVSAWGESGPWADRRGFDSIVQAASGIALIERADPPGALPAQALDHATGYLLAAGVVDGLTDRVRVGRGTDVRAALARTAADLLAAPGRSEQPGEPTNPGADTLVEHGGIRTARPALAAYADFPAPARQWGADPADWVM